MMTGFKKLIFNHKLEEKHNIFVQILGNTKKCVIESLVSGNGKSLKNLQLNRNAFGIQTNFSSIGILIADNMKHLKSLKLEFNTTPEGMNQ